MCIKKHIYGLTEKIRSPLLAIQQLRGARRILCNTLFLLCQEINIIIIKRISTCHPEQEM